MALIGEFCKDPFVARSGDASLVVETKGGEDNATRVIVEVVTD